MMYSCYLGWAKPASTSGFLSIWWFVGYGPFSLFITVRLLYLFLSDARHPWALNKLCVITTAESRAKVGSANQDGEFASNDSTKTPWLSFVSNHFTLNYFITTMIHCLSILQIMAAMYYQKCIVNLKKCRTQKRRLGGNSFKTLHYSSFEAENFLSANIWIFKFSCHTKLLHYIDCDYQFA